MSNCASKEGRASKEKVKGQRNNIYNKSNIFLKTSYIYELLRGSFLNWLIESTIQSLKLRNLIPKSCSIV